MKRLIKINIGFFGCMLSFLVCAQMSGPVLIQTTPVPDRTETDEITYVIDSVPYVPGGVTLTYPVSAFNVAPCIHVQADVPTQVADTVFIASVSSNTSTGVTVIVYKITSTAGVPTGMVEADLMDNVTVCLYATGV